MSTALLLLTLNATPAAATPTTAVLAAHRDAASLGVAAQDCRYLSLYNVPAKQRTDVLNALSFWCNSLSREAEIIKPVLVAPDLVRINLDDYGWSRKVWEKLAERDSYFHAQIETVVEEIVIEQDDYGYWQGQGANRQWIHTRWVPVERKVKKRIRQTGAAPWLPAKEMAALITLTQTTAPIVRADWWIVETAINAERKGTGYYSFLGLKSRKDFEQLVGLDKQASIRLRKEIAAIITDSGVAPHNRQVYRFQSITGGYWITLDVNESADRKNAVRLLNGDFVDNHDAEEHYGFLPNGLFAYYLSQADGKQLDTAPDTIASDHTSSSNDHRLHVGLSCVRCHTEGIRPIDDVARRLYRGAIALQSPDPFKLRRLRQLYLSDLPKYETRDRQDFAEAVKACNGLGVEENAKVFGATWKRYQDDSVTVATAELELGIESGKLVPALKVYSVATGSLDPVLAFFIQNPPLPVRRDHFEESFGLLQAAVKGYKP